VFENTVGIPSQVTWVDDIQQPAFLQVDPTLHWANPLSIEVPTPPFNLFVTVHGPRRARGVVGPLRTV
jgi:hypothetical protein